MRLTFNFKESRSFHEHRGLTFVDSHFTLVHKNNNRTKNAERHICEEDYDLLVRLQTQ